MTREQWARIEVVFREAHELPSGAERDAYLQTACAGDGTLRRNVERLLAGEAESGFESPVKDALDWAAMVDLLELAEGDPLGPYQMEAKVGEGGMGAVYRAHDSRLQRRVALKVIRPGYVLDENAKRRLVREARAASSLNHPNIVTIYEIGEDRGYDFIAMEYVEGRTLEEEIGGKGLPAAKLLGYASQIAGALRRAHEAKIVHRDIKPSNVMVTADGLIKVLDFGLAKPFDRQAGEVALTGAGLIPGTADYMSPEQVEGRTLDARSDIFSFGCVLYEMAAGVRPFKSDSRISTLHKVVHEEPPALLDIPHDLRWIIRRTLRKDPERRFQTAADLKAALEDCKEQLSAGVPDEPGPADARGVLALAAPAPPRPSRIWFAAAVAGVALATVFAVLWQHDIVRREPAPAVRMSLGVVGGGSLLSPDGSAMIWADRDDLRLRRLDELLPRPLPGTEGARLPFWAGDSSAFGFFQQGKLCIQSLRAEGIRCLAPAPQPGGAAWRGTAASGDMVFASGAKLMHLNLATGSLREVPLNLPADQFPLNPTFLPQGGDFVITAGPRDGGAQTLYRVSLRSGALTRLMETPYAVAFARHTHNGRWYMFYSSALAPALTLVPALMTVPVDPATGQALGTPAQLVDGVGTSPAMRLMAAELSENGRIIFRRNRLAAPVFRVRWHAPDGKVLASLGDKMACNEILLSPDESSVAATTGYPQRNILVFDARTGHSRRLTAAADSVGQGLAWSPDGGTLYYQIERPDGTWSIVRQDTSGVARPEVIGHVDFAVTLMDISHDGRYLIFGPNAAVSSSFYRLRTDGAADSKPEVWVSSGPNFTPGGAMARFTPDGKFVFATGRRNDARFIPWRPDQPAATVNARAVTFALTGPFFSPDGRRLCGVDREDAGLACQSVTTAPDGSPLLGPPSFQFGGITPQLGTYSKVGAIARDGRFLLLSTDEPEEFEWQFLTDWTMLLPEAAR